jgi:hypothetical protein
LSFVGSTYKYVAVYLIVLAGVVRKFGGQAGAAADALTNRLSTWGRYHLNDKPTGRLCNILCSVNYADEYAVSLHHQYFALVNDNNQSDLDIVLSQPQVLNNGANTLILTGVFPCRHAIDKYWDMHVDRISIVAAESIVVVQSTQDGTWRSETAMSSSGAFHVAQ